jgi:nucleoside-diphosphate-sugar epimerase
MRYFVTGATGFVGGHVARLLRQNGHDVIALVRDPRRAGDLLAQGITLASGDVAEKASMRAPMTGVDGVFHVAGWYKIGVHDTRPAQVTNVDGTRNVLELMRDLGIPRGVYTSTLAVYSDTHGQLPDETYVYRGRHLSVYDASKWAAHYEVAEPMMRDGLPLTIVQPGLVYGPGDTSAIGHTLRQYLKRKLPVVPARTAFCWGHVEDMAQAHLAAMRVGKPGASYNIGGPVHTLTDALRLAQSITGVRPPAITASPGMMCALAGTMSLVERVLPVPEDFSGEYLRVSAGVTYLGDSSKATRELGFAPRPLAEGLRETLLYEMGQLGMRAPAAAQ